MKAHTITKQLKDYFAHTAHPVQFAYLFGSVARGQAQPFSDVDVAVYLDSSAKADPYRVLLPMVGDITHTLHTDEVDLACLNTVPPDLAFRVLEDGRLLYSRDEPLRARVETQILERFYDQAPVDQEYDRYLDARILASKMGQNTPEMIDTKSVRKRLGHIDRMLMRLGRFAQMPQKEFLADEDALEMADRELQTCVEAMSDICTHIVAALGLERPQERSDVPLILGRAGILPQELAKRLSEAIEMRNILVHGYIDVDHARVYTTIAKELHYFQEFSQHIVRYVQKLEKRGGDRQSRQRAKK